MNTVAFGRMGSCGPLVSYTPVSLPSSITNYNNNSIKLVDVSSPLSSKGSPCSSDSTSSPVQKSCRDPEPDSIKMFVGQVPKSMEEAELKELFAKFGEIHQLNILRDKATGQHRGCCFVTFYTRKAAIMAQDELHGRHTLPGMHHPIQMKPADNEKKNVEDRKLFIGMVSKKLSENDIRKLFSPYGSVEDCMILRDTAGVSRGCAFVTYSVRQSALNAIQNMHHSQTMEGCSSPLVVKFADTQKDKEVRIKFISPNNNVIAGSPYSGASLAGLNTQYMALLQQSLSNTGNLSLHSPLSNMDIAAIQNLQNLQHLQQFGMLNGQGLIGLPAMAHQSPLAVTRSYNSATNGHALINGLNSSPPTPGSSLSSLGGASQFPGPLAGAYYSSASMNPAVDAALSQAYSGIAQYTASFPHAYSTGPQPTLATDSAAGKQTEGPDGANLFIYHLPQEFVDSDLLQAFMPFGSVVSAKVFVDKQTNLSKCFGFVSYDNPLSAQAAIATMNGFQVGMKRLKVQLKRPKNENKPY